MFGLLIVVPGQGWAQAPFREPASVRPEPAPVSFSEPDVSPPRTTGEEKNGEKWYGWADLVIGASAAGLMFGLNDPAAYWAGFGAIFLAPPVVHWAHGKTRKGFVSLGIGLGLGVVGSASGVLVACTVTECEGLDKFGGILAGALSGGLIFLIVDSAFLAWDSPERTDAATPHNQRTFSVFPKIQMGPDSMVLGVGGYF